MNAILEHNRRTLEMQTETERIQKYKKRVGNYKKKTKRDNLGKNLGENNEIIWSQRIKIGYLTHCLAKIVLEIIFLTLSFKLQKCQTNGLFEDGSQFWGSLKENRLFGRTWIVPEKFICEVFDSKEADILALFDVRPYLKDQQSFSACQQQSAVTREIIKKFQTN